ncbi:UPF0496 protein At4g34320-like [Impatiens glandulifera]|uniref:UPF0496 protein At4g34320-like n=1 Tax=Impatiens glandulifera TaxID=253017 RepID=UPI001FB07FE6|nr:UPF0496 protein At4g34320-like [Impatiens glandulifera]
MGCQISKTAAEAEINVGTGAISQTQMQNANLDPIQLSLTSYEDACRLDSDLQSFDSVLQQRTDRVITILAANGLERNLSMNAFGEVTRFLNEMNQDTVDFILAYKKDIWKDNGMCDLVQEYFDCSLLTLDFCTSLQSCLKRARNSQLMINFALNMFESEKICDGGKNYERTLQELRNFSAAANPFDDEFLSLLQSLPMKQRSLLQKLQRTKTILDAKLKSAKTWKRVSNVIFATVFAGVIVFSIVATAISAPPVVIALAGAAAVPLGTMGKWLNSLWTKYQKELKEQRVIVTTMETGTFLAIRDLEGIRIHVHRLEIKIEALLQNADFAVREEDEAVMVAVEEMKKMIDGFIQAIDDLTKSADKTRSDLTMARTVIVKKIIRQTSDH